MTDGRGAIFLDRDGVINENVPSYVRAWDQMRFLPGSIDAIRRLTAQGWPIVVVTNQSGIGRGAFAESALQDIHTRMLNAIAAEGGRIASVRYCPHRPDESCACRKPRPGMLTDAIADLVIDSSKSFMIGDHETDCQAGQAAGCTPLLVRSGRDGGFGTDGSAERAGYRVFDDLAAAASWIIQSTT